MTETTRNNTHHYSSYQMMHRSDRPVGNGDDVPSTSCADSGFASAEEKMVAVLPPSTAYQDVTAPYFFLSY